MRCGDRDPAEGVDAEGRIVTGAAAERVPAVYRPVLADCIDVPRRRFAARLHSLHLYGSVSTGQARAPDSDLDLLAVWATQAPAEAGRLAGELSARHAPVVRDVALASSAVADVLANDRTGLGIRCFLRHYRVWLAGADPAPVAATV